MTDHFTRDKLAWLRQIAEDSEIPDSCCRLAIVLGASYMSRAEGCAWPSQETLARDTGFTARSISTQIAALVAAGHLEVDTGAQRYGRGHTNRYTWRLKRSSVEPETRKLASGFREPETLKPASGFRPETRKLASCKPGSQLHAKPGSQLHANPLKEPYEEPYEVYRPRQLDLGDEKQASEKAQPSGDFEDWYAHYPLKKAKAKAKRAYRAIIQNRKATPAELRAGAMRYAAERTDEDQKYTKHPATWLNGECWKDEPAQPGATRQNGAGLEGLCAAGVAYMRRNGHGHGR